MATTNSVWNGVLLGTAFAGLLGYLVQNQFVSLWAGIGNLSDLIISSWSGFSGFSTNVMTYALFIIVGALIGLYVEKR